MTPPTPPDGAHDAAGVPSSAPADGREQGRGLVTLLTDDAWLTMPPLPLEYQGRELAREQRAASFQIPRTLPGPPKMDED
jgi:hypothetical protein